MGYEYEETIKEELEFTDLDNTDNQDEMLKELKEVYRKAKAFDEIREFITKKLKEEEEEQPRTLLSDYDFGLYQAYDNVDDIMQEHMERADDDY